MGIEFKTDIRKLCEEKTLSYFFADYNVDITYDEIIEDFQNGNFTLIDNEKVIIWDVFDNYDVQYIAKLMREYFYSQIEFANKILKMK
jgi:hypothetical protein